MIHTGYVIGLIDGENALTDKEKDYPRPYGIPENARGLEYFKKAKEGDLVLGYKTIMYRKYREGKRFWCKNNGIFAVFKVKSEFRDIRRDRDWFKDHPNWDRNYPNIIFLSEPLFFLRKNRIVFQDLKNLVPESEYVNNYRRSVTRFSKTQAKKIFRKMAEKENNPKIAEKIKKIFQMDLNCPKQEF